MNNFLEYRTIRATLFARQNDFYSLLAINKAKHVLISHFSCSCSELFNCVFVTFPYGILGQVWYLMVWIPDHCQLSYFEMRTIPGLHK